MMACVAIMGLSVLLWTMFGYSLSFGGNHAGIIGDFRWAFLNDVGWEAGPYADTIPHLVFAAFQMMFAMITPALITGAVVGRMRFKALFAFIALWSFLVYYPMAHMVWGEGGFLAAIGSVDFAGGNVVHISSGVSALVLATYLGRRKGYEKTSYRIHNIPFVVLGASLLWFGWFGFNAGSALAADGLAAHAFMTSAISSAAAGRADCRGAAVAAKGNGVAEPACKRDFCGAAEYFSGGIFCHSGIWEQHFCKPAPGAGGG